MSSDKFKKLVNKYPFLTGFDERRKLSISCREGWYNPIARLCETIADILDNKEGASSFRVVQVKQKFGNLCFYADGADDEIYQAIRQAEKEASSTCEICGSTDASVKTEAFRRFWIETLCEKCVPRSITEWLCYRSGLVVKQQDGHICLHKREGWGPKHKFGELVKVVDAWRDAIRYIVAANGPPAYEIDENKPDWLTRFLAENTEVSNENI